MVGELKACWVKEEKLEGGAEVEVVKLQWGESEKKKDLQETKQADAFQDYEKKGVLGSTLTQSAKPYQSRNQQRKPYKTFIFRNRIEKPAKKTNTDRGLAGEEAPRGWSMHK